MFTTIESPGSNDCIYLDDENNSFDGGIGNDCIFGLGGADNLDGELGDDTLIGGNGGDALRGGQGNDKLYGENGADTIYGDEGNDRLFGGSGNDILIGAGGTQELDTLTGGPQADDFYLTSFYIGDGENGYGTITDFDRLEGDDIWIDASYEAGISLGTGNWEGSDTLDTGIFYNNDLIGVVQDFVGLNSNADFIFFNPPRG